MAKRSKVTARKSKGKAKKSKGKAKKSTWTAKTSKAKAKTRKGKGKKKKINVIFVGSGAPNPLAITGDIGILSTIDLPEGWRRAFKDGLNDPNVRLKVKHKETYKRPKLRRAIEAFNTDPDIGMIVTVGGLVVSEVADNVATKPFLSLVGAAPANNSAKFFGGVTLESYKSNPARIGHLGGLGFPPGEIGLFYNPNSAMSGKETAAWTGATPVGCTVDSNGDVNPATYPADLAKFPSSVKAIVVSADPFFTETMNKLVDAANRTGKRLCYPLQDYGDATPAPTAGKTTLFGPSLKSSYKLLGRLAKVARDTGTKLDPLLVAIPDIIKDI